MTQADEPPHPPAPYRGRWRIFLPTALLGLAAALWSGFWFVAAHKADEAVGVWLKREAARGRVYDCGERSAGGYPFRIEIDCRNVTVKIPGDGGDIVASAPRFVALAQVYDPKRLIGELTGPVSIASADGGKADLTFAAAQSSARIDDRRFERGSLVLTAPRLVAGETEIGTASRLEAHLRRTPDGEDGAYDLAASLDGGVSPVLDRFSLGSGPVAAELQAEARGVPDLEPGPASKRLRAFAEAGGRITVQVARVSRGDVAAEARGELALDTEGRANGKLDVTARGVDSLARAMLGGEGEGDALSSLLGAGASMFGKKSELDGRPATTYRLKLDKGKVSLGPIRLTRLPPAF